MNFEKVLLATDLSPISIRLLDCVEDLKILGLEDIILTHVIDQRTLSDVEPALNSQEAALLDRNRAICEEMGLKVKIVTPVGIPAQEIKNTADEENASMIIVAPYGQSIVRGLLLGSTTTSLIRTSKLPILIEKIYKADKEENHPLGTGLFHRVLLPIDFSVHSLKVLEEIIDSAAVFDEIVMLSVIDAAHNDEELLKEFEASEHRLKEYQAIMEQKGVKVKTIVLDGDASTNIVSVSEQEAISLIIMATRGEGLIKDILLGSTAHSVARRSKGPVMLIPSSRMEE